MNCSRRMDWLFGLRASFYFLAPEETYSQDLQVVASIKEAVEPVWVVMVLLEAFFIRLRTNNNNWRLHEVVVNLSIMGLTNATSKVVFRGAEVGVYYWVYNNWRLTTLPWDSPYTYILALLMVEFMAYWRHRLSHEVALLWVVHQVHHSSEDFNLLTDNRASAFRPIFKWMFYVPLVLLGLPPAILLVHLQLGAVYPAWTHTTTIPKLSKVFPGLGHLLEYFMATPSNHRVHHGSNKYCLDKNYGMVLIIFDRMFGTFAEERDDEDLVFGTLHQRDTHHIVGIQVWPVLDLWKKVQQMATAGDKVRALVYGPGWFPGTLRLGDPTQIPDVRGRVKQQLPLPAWFSCYMLVNGLVLYSLTLRLEATAHEADGLVCLVALGYLMVAYTSLGGLYDAHSYALLLEPVRLVLLLLRPVFLAPSTVTSLGWVASLFSLFLWHPVASLTKSRAKIRLVAAAPPNDQPSLSQQKEMESEENDTATKPQGKAVVRSRGFLRAPK